VSRCKRRLIIESKKSRSSDSARACGGVGLLLQNRVYVWTFFQHQTTGQSQSDHHTKPISCIAVSHDGKTAVTGTRETALK